MILVNFVAFYLFYRIKYPTKISQNEWNIWYANLHTIPDILYIVILRNDDRQCELKIQQNLNFRFKKVKALEMYDNNSSSRTVGEAFGVSKDQIHKLVKRKAEVLEE